MLVPRRDRLDSSASRTSRTSGWTRNDRSDSSRMTHIPSDSACTRTSAASVRPVSARRMGVTRSTTAVSTRTSTGAGSLTPRPRATCRPRQSCAVVLLGPPVRLGVGRLAAKRQQHTGRPSLGAPDRLPHRAPVSVGPSGEQLAALVGRESQFGEADLAELPEPGADRAAGRTPPVIRTTWSHSGRCGRTRRTGRRRRRRRQGGGRRRPTRPAPPCATRGIERPATTSRSGPPERALGPGRRSNPATARRATRSARSRASTSSVSSSSSDSQANGTGQRATHPASSTVCRTPPAHRRASVHVG